LREAYQSADVTEAMAIRKFIIIIIIIIIVVVVVVVEIIKTILKSF
jgi:t-SNARE complex subunit (syntaxin)